MTESRRVGAGTDLESPPASAGEPRTAGLAAVVFDMDGVLLDSEPFWQEAEMDAFGRIGLRLRRADCLRTMGMRVDEVVAFWLRRHPWDVARHPRERVAEDILEGVVDRVRARAEMLPGVSAGLEAVADRDVRRALASSSPDRVIDAVLTALDLASYFELTASAEHEPRGKPDPGVYLSACRRLGVTPARALAVEDSLAGLRAARAAGMVCAMVPDASIADRAELAEADVVLDSLADLAGAWTWLDSA